jgi:H+-transporting ATPase
MIEIAAILAALIHHWETFYIIMAMLLLNAGVGFWQRQKADNAIELLKEKMAFTALVRRDGAWGQIPARELAPGDIVRVRLGDIVPADLRLMDGEYLVVDESALTGESLPVEKTVGQVAYAGAIIRQEEMDGVVVATGMNSYFGKTARLVETARTASHLQRPWRNRCATRVRNCSTLPKAGRKKSGARSTVCFSGPCTFSLVR